mgnify:CR=1 FL=1
MSHKPTEFLKQFMNFSSKILGDEKRIYFRSSSSGGGLRTSQNNSSISNNERYNPMKLKPKHYSNLRDIFFNILLHAANAIPNIEDDSDLFDKFKKRIEILIDAFIKISLFTEENVDLFFNIFKNKEKDNRINEELINLISIKDETLFLSIKEEPFQKNVLYKQFKKNYIYLLSKINNSCLIYDNNFVNKYEKLLKGVKQKFSRSKITLGKTTDPMIDEFLSIMAELSSKKNTGPKQIPKVKFFWQIFNKLAPAEYKINLINSVAFFISSVKNTLPVGFGCAKSLFNFLCYIIAKLTKEEKEKLLESSKKKDNKPNHDTRFFLFEGFKNLITKSEKVQEMIEVFHHENNYIYDFWKFIFGDNKINTLNSQFDTSLKNDFYELHIYRFLKYLNYFDQPFLFDCYKMHKRANFMSLTSICNYFCNNYKNDNSSFPKYPLKGEDQETHEKQNLKNIIFFWKSFDRLIFSPTEGDIRIENDFHYPEMLMMIKEYKNTDKFNPFTYFIDDKLLMEYYFEILLNYSKIRVLTAGKNENKDLSDKIMSYIIEDDTRSLFISQLEARKEPTPSDPTLKGLSKISIAFCIFLKICFFLSY